jgi:hypothetical protein
VGLSPDDPIWHPTTFTKNRDRLLKKRVMGEKRILERRRLASTIPLKRLSNLYR